MTNIIIQTKHCLLAHPEESPYKRPQGIAGIQDLDWRFVEAYKGLEAAAFI